MNDIPIKCLRKETRDLISALLNPKKIIPNEKGLSRDWHGLAELCGIGGEKIPNIEQTNDPTLKILEIWSEKNKNDSTVAKLLSYLESLDRFDVVEDIASLIEKDAEYYRAHPEGFTVDLQDFDDKDIITFDDVERKRDGLPPQTYDAFVLFADDDIGFATDIINTLEGQYNMKLCEKSRDVIGGENSYDSVIRLISTRCNRVIVVVSPSFLESPTNKYFYSLAQIDGIERQRRKIIPCIYKKCLELPLEFRAYHLLDFTRTEKLFFNFWDQLYKSIKVVIPPSTRPTLPQIEPVVFNKTTEASKSTNHVKFGFVEQPPKVVEQPPKVIEPEEKEDNPIPDQVFPEVPTSAPSTPEFEHSHNELKKKNSFYRKFWKILHQKTEQDQTEVPQINMVSKKKKFWKRNKLKMAVAN